MSLLIDLTLTLGGDRITAVPGLTTVETTPLQTHETHARSNTKLTLPTHIGTHVDAPYHFVETGKTIDEMPLEKFVGPAILVDLRDLFQAQSPISKQNLLDTLQEQNIEQKIVVLFTGWAETNSGKDNYYSSGPYLSNEAALFLRDSSIKAVAIDFPIDKHPETPKSTKTDFPVHRILLTAEIPIIENLINLHLLISKTFSIWALPLKLKNGDGTATRAVAVIN